MKRRSLLATLGASTSAVGAAGCLQGSGDPGDGTTDHRTGTTTSGTDGTRSTVEDSEPTSDEPESTADDGGDEWDPAGEPVETLAAGSREGLSFASNNRPHSLVLWNRADREREVVAAYSDGRTEELERLGPVAVPADATIQIDLQVPTHYTFTVRADGEELGGFEVGREWFDCNSSGSQYALGANELVHHGSLSTAAGCPSPKAVTTDLSVSTRDCGTQDDERAIVGYGDETVDVSGTFVSGSPCRTLSVASTTYDPKSRTARVVVDAGPDDEGGCVNCVGAIQYEAAVVYENDFPDHVELVHRSLDGEERVVATAAWNDDV